jgi:hypothetical protein
LGRFRVALSLDIQHNGNAVFDLSSGTVLATLDMATETARYCIGYLGDIGMPPPYAAGDFAGWFEAYIGGRWYTFDARNNIPRIGRVLMAQGRDAADVPITQTFGPNTLL